MILSRQFLLNKNIYQIAEVHNYTHAKWYKCPTDVNALPVGLGTVGKRPSCVSSPIVA